MSRHALRVTQGLSRGQCPALQRAWPGTALGVPDIALGDAEPKLPLPLDGPSTVDGSLGGDRICDAEFARGRSRCAGPRN